jgi:peptide/nickel transport system ATP-binding protein
VSVVLEVSGLTVGYRVQGRWWPALEDVSWRLESGQTVALVGESGSGKTTAAHAIVGLLAHNAQIKAGRIRIGQRDLTGCSERALSRIRGWRIGFVPQDPGQSLNPSQRIGRQVVEARRLHGLTSRGQTRQTAIDLLAAVGLDQPERLVDRYPHQLSGGQRQRVLIASAVSCDPDLVVADEPTSALDVTVQKIVLDHLAERSRSLGAAVLLITHDLGLAADRADHVIVLRAGRVVEAGPSAAVLGSPAEPYTRQLAAASPSLNSRRLRPRVGPRADSTSPAAGPLVEAIGLVKDFRSQRRDPPLRALDQVSFTVWPGRTTALVGASGSGKTTAARAVMRLTALDAGTIRLRGRDVTQLPRAEWGQFRRSIQMIYQNPLSSLDPRSTVAELVEAPLRAFKIGQPADRRRRVAALLDAVALPGQLAGWRPVELSGGQCQRVAIARALAPEPAVLVLDEPVSALDVSVQDQILRLLVDLQAESGVGFLFISHDLAVVRQIGDQVWVLSAGRVVESGPAQTVLRHPQHPYTRELLDAIPGARRQVEA